MFQKNQEWEVTIDDIGAEGEGIGHIGTFTVFVKGGLPGERWVVRLLKVGKSFAYGKGVRLLQASEWRVSPFCPTAGTCGGCHLQHCRYDGQLELKAKRVKDALSRIGGFESVEVRQTLGMADPTQYRNKVQFPLVWDGPVCMAAFYAPRSHRPVPIRECGIQHPLIQAVVPKILAFVQAYGLSLYCESTHKGLLRHVMLRVGCATGEVMVCLVTNGRSIPHMDELVNELQATGCVKTIVQNINRARTNVILGDETKIWFGPGYIRDFLHDLEFRISPVSFFQVNPVQTKVLYDQVIAAGFRGDETVVDAYCGIGSISLYVARHVRKVIGIECVPQAIADAKINAAQNKITNAEFLLGDAGEVMRSLAHTKVDAVIVDPPRKGCSATLLQTIADIRPRKLVYVSCDPATLARDLKMLREMGYLLPAQRIVAQPVDMFAHTAHVECVVSVQVY